MNRQIAEMKQAHNVLASFTYEPCELVRGYARRSLRVDLSKKEITIQPVDDKMIDLWTGGRGFDMWLMFNEISESTKWDSPENPICFSSGPLGGVASFPGAGKTIVTAISPLTNSIIDCNVGGYFGPYFKFCGFDALTVTGQSDEEVIVVIDGDKQTVTIETAPQESIDAHVVSEELTEMYAVDDEDRRNVSVVSAGRGAQHSWMGVLNFSFYDWRRGVARLKQAGRGGIGSVLRHKKVKALVCKNREITPAWRVSHPVIPNPPQPLQNPCGCGGNEEGRIVEIIDRWKRDKEYVIEMMQDIQEKERHISRNALDVLSRELGLPRGQLYHIATFYKAFSLKPRGETLIQVCMGTACHVKGAPRILDAFERELDVKRGDSTADGKFSLEAVACLGCCSIAPVVKIGDEILGNVEAKDVKKLLKTRGHGGKN